MENYVRLAVLVDRLEQRMTPLQKLKLARIKLAKATGVSADKTKESSKQVDDTKFDKNQKDSNKLSSNIK